MSPWDLALWGAAGGLMVEAIQFYGAIKATGTWPWRSPGEPRPLPLLVSVAIRVGVGFGLALAAADNNQVTGGFGAIAIGVAAPLLIEQMAKTVPSTHTKTEVDNGGTSRQESADAS